MTIRAPGNGPLIGSMICFVAALALLAPGRALADDLVGDTAESTQGVVEDAVDDVTEVVTEIVDEVADAVDDAGDEVTPAVGGVVNDVNEATGDAARAGGIPDGITGAEGESSGSDAGDGTPAQRRGGQQRAGFLVTISRPSDPGVRRWEPVNALGLGVTGTSSGLLVQTTGEPDRCEEPRVVCLGLLFGQGEFEKLGDDVLGFLATTGIGVIGWMVIAFLMGVGGSGALVASRDRSPSARPAG